MEKSKNNSNKKKYFETLGWTPHIPKTCFFAFVQAVWGFLNGTISKEFQHVFLLFSLGFLHGAIPKESQNIVFPFYFLDIYIYILLFVHIFNLVVPKTSGKLVVFLVSCSSAAFSTVYFAWPARFLRQPLSCWTPTFILHLIAAFTYFFKVLLFSGGTLCQPWTSKMTRTFWSSWLTEKMLHRTV